MRPISTWLHDNSRPLLSLRRPSRRSFAIGLAMAACATRLSALERPKRIVSTAPSITEALFALGLGDQVVGVSRYCKFPPAVQKLPKVGSYIAPDAEAIARLVPDLVVLEHTSTELTGRLQALHIAYVQVPHGTLADVYTGIDMMARAAAVPERGTTLNVRIQNELGAIAAQARKLPSPRILVLVGRRPGMLAELTAVGPDNYLEKLLEIAGGTNVLALPGLPLYPRISLETVLRDDPEMILDMSGAMETAAEQDAERVQVLALWAQQPQLTAVRTGRVVVGTSNALLVPGPRAPDAARLLFGYMHPGSGH